jgi:integrase
VGLPKGSNPNAPRKGDIIKVEPIRDIKAIRRIKQITSDNIVHHSLFVVGINSAFRASDLLSLRLRDVLDKRIVLREQKTGNVRTVTINPATRESIDQLVKARGIEADDYLFSGLRGRYTVNYANALVKQWCREVGLAGNYGSHTLRKTWGYHQRVTYKVDLPLLMKAYGHSSQRQTLTYLCIEEQEVQDIYLNAL